MQLKTPQQLLPSLSSLSSDPFSGHHFQSYSGKAPTPEEKKEIKANSGALFSYNKTK